MNINTVKSLEVAANKTNSLDFLRLGMGLFFVVGASVYALFYTGDFTNTMFLAIAAVFAAYMSMNIGANDVANNVGPAVGAKALTMGGAIVIAAVFEASGAFIAGGDVISTIKKGIIDIESFENNTDSFVWAMMAALLAAALWLNYATITKTPVSTTHSIVGGVMGAGIAAGGFGVVAWGTMGNIAMSWVISPLLGGIIAAVFLFSIKMTILDKKDKIKAAHKWVPIYVAIMSWSFGVYLTLKGLKKVWPDIVNTLSFLPDEKKPSFLIACIIGIIAAGIFYFISKSSISKKLDNIKNTSKGVNSLFTIPLVFAAALLSFAHGANDVANAIGPLAAIADAIGTGTISSKASIPIWVIAIGAIGLALGLAMYGPRLIRTVGGEITNLVQTSAFAIAMAASITVIVASQLGLPVSSTHIAIGGIFGVGFLREYLFHQNDLTTIEENKENVVKKESVIKAMNVELNRVLGRGHKKKKDYQQVVKLYSKLEAEEKRLGDIKRDLKSSKKIVLVKRDAIKKIIAAWIITVPVAAALSAFIYFIIRGVVL